MEECVFCKIVRKELPSYLVFEDTRYIAFLDIRPINPGHTLVVPKAHHRWVWDLPEPGRYFETATEIARCLQKTMKTDWIAADVAGMGVAHAHIHLVPRFPGDGHGEFINGQNVKTIAPDEMKRIAEKIRNGVLGSVEKAGR
ncbi:MAG TPA: HIT family protein [Candidatus Dormibacteraeota bacterium]|nr:HIT family protein [Candidatus Dormibacteraeota bacterium]